MNIKAFALLAGSALSAASFAAVIYSQAPLVNGEGGPYSFPGQVCADNFRLASADSYSHVTFWGSVFGAGDPLTIGTTQEYRFRLFSTSAAAFVPNALLNDQTVNAKITGKFGLTSSADMVYRWEADITSVSVLASTDYWLSVMNTSATPAFRWHNAVAVDGNAAFSTTNTQSWGVSNGDRGDFAFELGQAVPEPATWAAFGLGALLVVRRRRTR